MKFCRWFTFIVLWSCLLGAIALPAKAQRNEADLSSSLLEGADCQVSGSTGWSRLYDEAAQVSINRQVFDRQFAIYAYDNANFVTLSCRADSDRYGLVDLQMGVDDNAVRENVNLRIDVYQGGNLRHTFPSMRAGSTANVVLDLNNPDVSGNPNNFAVEMICYASGGNCYLHFLEARLYPASSFTTFPQTSTPSSLPQGNYPTGQQQPQVNPERQEPERSDRPSQRNTNPLDILRDANEAREIICGIFGC